MAFPPRTGLGVGARQPTAQTAQKQGTDLSKLSYGQLAVAKTQPILDKVADRLSRITENAEPYDPGLKNLRHDMQELRDNLDVFAFAWGKPGKQKAWVDLRRRVDEGYETLGHFKDLFDSQGLEVDAQGRPPPGTKYDKAELKERKKALLQWKEDFTKGDRLRQARELVNDPSEPASVPDRELSSFFWGGVKVRPDPSLSGMQNVKRLALASTDRARDELKDLVRLRDLQEPQNAEAFHNGRKRFRALANMVKRYPELTNAAAVAPTLTQVDSAVDGLGDIEDDLVAYNLAKGHGANGNAGDIKRKIADQWSTLQRELSSGRLDRALQSLNSALSER